MTSDRFEIVDVRAFIPTKEDGDYFGREVGHWIRDSVIANPMSVYPAYKQTRTSWGVDALGGLIVELEARDGTVGVGVSQGGIAGGAIIERHLKRFLVGSDPRDVERLW